LPDVFDRINLQMGNKGDIFDRIALPEPSKYTEEEWRTAETQGIPLSWLRKQPTTLSEKLAAISSDPSEALKMATGALPLAGPQIFNKLRAIGAAREIERLRPAGSTISGIPREMPIPSINPPSIRAPIEPIVREIVTPKESPESFLRSKLIEKPPAELPSPISTQAQKVGPASVREVPTFHGIGETRPVFALKDLKTREIIYDEKARSHLQIDRPRGAPLENYEGGWVVRGEYVTDFARAKITPALFPEEAPKRATGLARLKPEETVTLYRGAKQEIYGPGGETELKLTRWTPDINVARGVGGKYVYKVEVPASKLLPAQELFDPKVASPDVLAKWSKIAEEKYKESAYPSISASLEAPGEPQVLLPSGKYKLERVKAEVPKPPIKVEGIAPLNAKMIKDFKLDENDVRNLNAIWKQDPEEFNKVMRSYGEQAKQDFELKRIGKTRQMGEEGLFESPKTQPELAPKPSGKPRNLLSWVRSKGGIWDESLKGETQQFGPKESGVIGLISKKGRMIDELATEAVEEGWMLPGSGTNGFIAALNREVRAAKFGGSRIGKLGSEKGSFSWQPKVGDFVEFEFEGRIIKGKVRDIDEVGKTAWIMNSDASTPKMGDNQTTVVNFSNIRPINLIVPRKEK